MHSLMDGMKQKLDMTVFNLDSNDVFGSYKYQYSYKR